MKHHLNDHILTKIAELGGAMVEGFFPAKYPEAKMWRKMLGFDSSYKFSKQTFSSLLSKLKNDGLVERANGKKKAFWTITTKGKGYLERKKDPIAKLHDGITRIVIFDIPEKERKKRRWLREHLLELEYRQLQKSVWIGDVPIPQKFLKDADILSLRDHVHIFSVLKGGTLIS